MQFYAKSALDKKQLNTKMSIGCDGIEIQLRKELFNKGLNHGSDSYYFADEVFDLDSFNKYPIKVIHYPIVGLNIETLITYNFKLLDQVFYIANHFGIVNNSKVIVVIHSESNINLLRDMGDTWKTIMNSIGCLLFKYPNTELAIENVPPFELYKTKLYLRNNFGFDNVEMVKELKKQLNTDRVGTVLDTCHAMMTNMYMNALSKLIVADSFNMEGYTIDDFFKMNKDVIKLIHLSDSRDDGLLKNHGVGFTDKLDSRMTLSGILGSYSNYGYTCPITLEVSETDYLVSDNYARTLKVVKELSKGM
jgi:hypothetical protein